MSFNSFNFREFANNNNIKIKTSSPHYPTSNRLAEKAVHIAKNMLKKSLEEGKGINEYLA